MSVNQVLAVPLMIAREEPLSLGLYRCGHLLDPLRFQLLPHLCCKPTEDNTQLIADKTNESGHGIVCDVLGKGETGDSRNAKRRQYEYQFGKPPLRYGWMRVD